MDLIKVAIPQVDEADIAAMGDAMRSGQLVSGPRVRDFEEAFAAHTGTAHAVAVNSGTAAIQAALDAIGVGPGDEVVVPAMTFFSTATAVIHQGGIPVFCDIDPITHSMGADQLRSALTPRTKAVIPVHFYGNVADIDGIRAELGDRDIAIIEDCAQSHGSAANGRRTGSIGEFGAFSFFATKHMTTCEGGMVTTDDADAAARMRLFRSHGLEGRHDHTMLGYNYRMPEVFGALGLTQLKRLDELNESRIRISLELMDRLADIPWITLPTPRDGIVHTFFWLHAEIDEDALGMTAQELIPALRAKGVEVRNRYVEPLTKQPLLRAANLPPMLRLQGDAVPDYPSTVVPNSERLSGRVIGLPNRPDMTSDEIDQVEAVLKSF